jgi:hypothetical protein
VLPYITRAFRIVVLGSAVFGFLTYVAIVAAPMLILRMLAFPLFGLTVAVLHLGTTELVDVGRLTRAQSYFLTVVLTMATVLFWSVVDKLVGPSR